MDVPNDSKPEHTLRPHGRVTSIQTPRRFYSLDVLRGIAALSVVFWHWQHFFLPFNPGGAEFIASRQPLFGPLRLLYEHGNEAVRLFFCLSGFIFFWLYSQRIADRAMSPRSFSVLRWSRLYPLHIFTLVSVALGQIAYSNVTGASFVYTFNDSYHFVLNLLFISAWGLEKGPSFNAPVWSVSVEVLVYMLFFVFCRRFHRHAIPMVAAAVGGYLVRTWNNDVGNGVMCFFIGGISFLAYDRLVRASNPRNVRVALLCLTALAWLVTLGAAGIGSGLALDGAPWVLRKLVAGFGVIALFPCTIVTLALIETDRGTLGRRFSLLGDISYSAYLLHFPLQLSAVLLASAVHQGSGTFYAPWFMGVFFGLLVALSIASHQFFELPCQNHLRRRFSSNKGAGRTA